MPAAIVLVNILLVALVVAAIVGACVASILTQHRDHGVHAEGSALRRRIWSRGGRPHAGPVRPWVVRGDQVWPAESADARRTGA